MHSTSLEYLQSRPRESGAVSVLQSLGQVLAEQVEGPQLRALAYLAGRALGAAHPISTCNTLSDVEAAANQLLRRMDWGWLKVEAGAADVQFLHGCSPLRSWFGADGLSWSGAIFEGIYAEWLQHLGAGEQLDLRQVGDAEGVDDVLRFRLAHQHQFEQA
ncbi:hypothetical protein JN531_009530 [Flagellatimonas centrodinii]|uniref:cellulose biosynthesis protein BcsD n=1 Tax=Flagellatimonas centrodinii TaxID=2806210 RepID=UPI001FEE38E0|nr:cellulose biosynthesis protein BcsD [Flagellatimonas centrodinii]ULQ45369.1 hypothetical protein JN531_009530 [Flagellatimonas centrodinii]